MKIIENISKDLEEFDKIFLFSDSESIKLLEEFCESDILQETSQKLLLLSVMDINIPYGKHEYRRISEEEQASLEQLYRMYDFSNRFQVLSDAQQYGGLLNYVKTGIMTREEVLQALLKQ